MGAGQREDGGLVAQDLSTGWMPILLRFEVQILLVMKGNSQEPRIVLSLGRFVL